MMYSPSHVYQLPTTIFPHYSPSTHFRLIDTLDGICAYTRQVTPIARGYCTVPIMVARKQIRNCNKMTLFYENVLRQQMLKRLLLDRTDTQTGHTDVANEHS